MRPVIIASAARTPIGRFGGALAGMSATALGAIAIRGALDRAQTVPVIIEEVFMGHVLSAGLGQAPATQAAILAGLPPVPATTVNKVCASGMKAIMLAAQSIALGQAGIVVAGGMESMSKVPFYLDKARFGYRIGHSSLTDGLIKDGLWDAYDDQHMGSLAERCATKYNISRQAQDVYAVSSYQRAQAAQTAGYFVPEIIPVELKDNKGNSTWLAEDEEPASVDFAKIEQLKPVFDKNGTITAANASTLNDGAAALVLMSEEKARTLNVRPLARILGFADAQLAPEAFTTAPAAALPFALQQAGLGISDIDYFEINEAFSAVALANQALLGLDAAKVNVHGGAVALGHPLGASGARIVVTLLNILQQHQGKFGAAAICNGGGGASAMVIERCI